MTLAFKHFGRIDYAVNYAGTYKFDWCNYLSFTMLTRLVVSETSDNSQPCLPWSHRVS